ncbi:unnamed protein product [Dovyalis caffra]|uniref:Uncharacterized protein n=1 Tax=Dovyalis caffra TaxID=77055 RepID=A0AAV1RPZ3_9ROSI|nr:unnamed protein product [Dovyalis caffra]
MIRIIESNLVLSSRPFPDHQIFKLGLDPPIIIEHFLNNAKRLNPSYLVNRITGQLKKRATKLQQPSPNEEKGPQLQQPAVAKSQNSTSVFSSTFSSSSSSSTLALISCCTVSDPLLSLTHQPKLQSSVHTDL